jgi:hypothetical protein
MELLLLVALCPSGSLAWYDETHLAIAKVAGYEKWFNAAGPDVTKLKMGDKEGHNHFVNNPNLCPPLKMPPGKSLTQAGCCQIEQSHAQTPNHCNSLPIKINMGCQFPERSGH